MKFLIIYLLLSNSHAADCESQGLIKKATNYLTRLFVKEEKVAVVAEKDLYEAFQNPAFKKRFFDAAKTAYKNYEKFDFDIPEMFQTIKRSSIEMFQEIEDIGKLKVFQSQSKELAAYKKLLMSVLKNENITYKEYVDLMIYRSIAKSQLLDTSKWQFDYFNILKENYRKAGEAMLKRNILVIPSYKDFSLVEMNQMLMEDQMIVGMTNKRRSFDGRKDQLPKEFFNHDPGHIHGDIDPFFRALDVGLVDRKATLAKVLKEIDSVDGDILNKDLHTILFAYSHELGTVGKYDVHIPSASFKDPISKDILKRTFQNEGLVFDEARIKKALEKFDDIWKEAYF